jgi:hypothetical protein
VKAQSKVFVAQLVDIRFAPFGHHLSGYVEAYSLQYRLPVSRADLFFPDFS